MVPTAEVPDPPSVTLDNAAESLCGLFLREFFLPVLGRTHRSRHAQRTRLELGNLLDNLKRGFYPAFAAEMVPTAEVPDPPSVTLDNAAESLCGLFLREVQVSSSLGRNTLTHITTINIKPNLGATNKREKLELRASSSFSRLLVAPRLGLMFMVVMCVRVLRPRLILRGP
jgi:hypothetical protein